MTQTHKYRHRNQGMRYIRFPITKILHERPPSIKLTEGNANNNDQTGSKDDAFTTAIYNSRDKQ
jgi:hypothetical protein